MKKRLAIWLGINLTVITAVSAVLFMKMHLGININCLSHQIFGLYCPGCGITRLLVSLIRGDIYTAFRYNPFVFISILPATGLYLYGSCHWIKRGDLTTGIGITVIIWGVLALLFGILRNIPVFAGMLAPP